jgi:hypothetical protein
VGLILTVNGLSAKKNTGKRFITEKNTGRKKIAIK